MQTLFKGNHIHIYRNNGLAYLQNGSLHQINTGQCNSILTRLHGLTDMQAEELIDSEYSQGRIKIVKPKKINSSYECHGRLFVDTNIYQKIYNGDLKWSIIFSISLP